MSRRDLLKRGVIVGMLGSVAVLGIPSVRDQLVEEAKSLAAVLRRLPGLGYGRDSVTFTTLVGGQPILEANGEEAGHWKGAPALTYDEATDRLLTHVRHRDRDERGHRVSLYEIDQETLVAEELVSVNKGELTARSMEGGELVVTDSEYRWLISYQHDEAGDWRIHERRAPTIDGLRTSGQDLDVASSFYHSKDPAIVNGELYLISSSKTWLRSSPERVSFDGDQPTATSLTVQGTPNARITGGGIVADEVFTDTWPNVLWTNDERSATGVVEATALSIDSATNFVSTSGGSVTYVDGERIGDTVYLLWQEGRQDGSKDLFGTTVDIAEYRDHFGVESR
jgi:hypothetical protein